MGAIARLTLYPSTGGFQVSHAGLAFARVYAVWRDRVYYDLIDSVPTGTDRKVRFQGGAFGRLRFSTDNRFNAGEKIVVLYKTNV